MSLGFLIHKTGMVIFSSYLQHYCITNKKQIFLKMQNAMLGLRSKDHYFITNS